MVLCPYTWTSVVWLQTFIKMFSAAEHKKNHKSHSLVPTARSNWFPVNAGYMRECALWLGTSSLNEPSTGIPFCSANPRKLLLGVPAEMSRGDLWPIFSISPCPRLSVPAGDHLTPGSVLVPALALPGAYN